MTFEELASCYPCTELVPEYLNALATCILHVCFSCVCVGGGGGGERGGDDCNV